MVVEQALPPCQAPGAVAPYMPSNTEGGRMKKAAIVRLHTTLHCEQGKERKEPHSCTCHVCTVCKMIVEQLLDKAAIYVAAHTCACVIN
eukprot:1142471-Pelagomonas_calceolata.AAC.10